MYDNSYFLTGKDVLEQNDILIGIEDVMSAIQKKQEKICTTELMVLNNEIAKDYDYVIHYGKDDVAFTREFLGDKYETAINDLYREIEKASKDLNSRFAEQVYQIAILHRASYWLLIADERREQERIDKIKTFSQYVQYRNDEIISSEKCYIFLIGILVFLLFIQDTILECVLVAFITIGFIALAEISSYRCTMRSKSKEVA